MFVYKVIRDLESKDHLCIKKDHLCINPIRRIGLIHKRSLDSCTLKWSVQVNVLLKDSKKNITSLSLLVGKTVKFFHSSLLLPYINGTRLRCYKKIFKTLICFIHPADKC